MYNKEPIFILGSGAIGIALAINLIESNRKVFLVRTRRDDISETKITISMKDIEGKIIKVPALSISLKKLTNIKGLIVITTKAYVNESIALQLKEKEVNSPIILMQNGLGVEESFLNQGFDEIYRCILFATSQTIDKDFVQYKPIALSPIGIIKGKTEKLKTIVERLTTPRFEFVVEENIKTIIWEKAIINSVFNSICPLLEIDNGIFYRDKEILLLGMNIVKECVAVAKATGVKISEDKIQKQILNISNLSTGQLISTLQDIQNNRKTEIQSLNLEIARIAKSFDQEISTTTTELLGKMILLKSEIKRSKEDT